MAFTDSDIVTGGPITLDGVWLHDLADPDGTVRQFRYGKSLRSTDFDPQGTQLLYAGRTDPVLEYGEHRLQSYSIGIHVPFGPDWEDDLLALQGFVEGRNTLALRDNRGRAMKGHLSDYQESDIDSGTMVTFRFTRVDVAETTVVI